MSKNHGSLLELIKMLDVGSRCLLRKDALLDLFKFYLKRIDDGEVSIDYSIHQCIEHKTGAVAQEFGLALAPVPHAKKSELASISH